MRITEDSLFEVTKEKGDNWWIHKINSISQWREWVAGWPEFKSEKRREWVNNLSPSELLDFIQKHFCLEFSEPGEVEKKQNIQKLAKSAFKENKIKSFKEQIIDFKLGKIPSGELLVVEDKPNKWNIEGVNFENKFVVIKQSFINKILEDHEIDFDLLVDVSNLIQKRVLSFESISYPNSRVVVLDAKDKYDRDILVALHLDIEKNKVQVSELSSIYGKKELGFLLENTIKLNKQIEITPKTNKWLLSNGVPFPALVTTYLQKEYNKKFGKSQEFEYRETTHDSVKSNMDMSKKEKTKVPVKAKGSGTR